MLKRNDAAGGKPVPGIGPDLSACGYPTEIGVYRKKDNQWIEIQPEVINWKTGGVLKSIASAGIVKGDVNGHLQGKSSRNKVNTPLEFCIYAPEGVAITEYQLPRLGGKDEYREFRTVTGGVLHVKGGATRDLVDSRERKWRAGRSSSIYRASVRENMEFFPLALSSLPVPRRPLARCTPSACWSS